MRELKRILLNHKDDFVQNMTEQMLSYALGRELDYFDELPVQQFTKAMALEYYHFSTLVLSAVSGARSREAH